MKYFILVTFGLLGFAFYELSGGAEFDPDSLRVSRVDATPLSPITPEPIQVAQVPAPEVTAHSNDVTRSTVTLASLSSVETGTRVSATLIPAVATEGAVAEEKVSALILPSLIAATDQPSDAPVQATLQQQETQAIVRTISGNRVNVRGGPGTNYDVVSRLVKGQEVEILSDPGQGWVKMRPVEGGSVGWLADFLLNES